MLTRTLLQRGGRLRGGSHRLGRRLSTAGRPLSGADMAGIAVFSGISMTAFGLGVWQYRRYNWKVALIKEGKDKMSCETEDLSVSSNLEKLLGKQVRFTGYFDHSREVLVGLRAPPAGTFDAAQGMGSNPQGYYVYTPLKLNFGPVIYVNRGWVPREHNRTWSRPEGSVTISAIVGEPEKPGGFTPKNDPRSGTLIWLNRDDLLQLSGLKDEEVEYEIFEELSAAGKEAKEKQVEVQLPVKRSSKADDFGKHFVTPETHMAYCFTWFSLSLLGFFMTYLQFSRKRRFIRKNISPKS